MTNTEIKSLKNKNVKFVPLTHTKAVIDDNGNTVDTLLKNLDEKTTPEVIAAIVKGVPVELVDTETVGQKIYDEEKNLFLNRVGNKYYYGNSQMTLGKPVVGNMYKCGDDLYIATESLLCLIAPPSQEFGNSVKKSVSQKTITDRLSTQVFDSVVEVPISQIINSSSSEIGTVVYNKTNNKFLHFAGGKYYAESATDEIVGTSPVIGKMYVDASNNTWIGAKIGLVLESNLPNYIGNDFANNFFKELYLTKDINVNEVSKIIVKKVDKIDDKYYNNVIYLFKKI